VKLDSSARRLYLSHATQVDVRDADSGKIVGIAYLTGTNQVKVLPGGISGLLVES
jgi:hypothetical protein